MDRSLQGNKPPNMLLNWLIGKIWTDQYLMCSGSEKFGSCSSRRRESSALLTSAQVLTTTTSNWLCGKDCTAKSCQVHPNLYLCLYLYLHLNLNLSLSGGHVCILSLCVLPSTRAAEAGSSDCSPNVGAPSRRHGGGLWGFVAEAAW